VRLIRKAQTIRPTTPFLARSGKADKLILLAADGIGLLALIALLSPGMHRLVQGFGAAAFLLLVIAVIGMGGVVIALLVRQLFHVNRIGTVPPVSVTSRRVETSQGQPDDPQERRPAD
jgi:TM2 domain-containing membrane protein YozV